MYLYFILLFWACHYTHGSPRTVDPLWTCSKSPLACVPISLGQPPVHECTVDTDCEAGARCCYEGCSRRCQLPDPCEKLLCKSGYSCLVRETPCTQTPCQKEATCVPEIQVLCTTPKCTTTSCPAGYTRTLDSNGCQTCQCERKKVCSSTCFLFCNYGYVLDSAGCPTCQCKPAPDNPCSKMSCPTNQECRLLKTECLLAPCKPRAACVNKTKVLYDNTCGLKDETTAWYPVLQSDNVTEVDCLQKPCSDGTICVRMSANVNRCCWQHTQEKVLGPQKVGQCPEEYMLDGTEMPQSCEIDAQCPGDQKCCYRNMMPGMTRYYGGCYTPIHKIVENAAYYCSRNPILQYIFSTVKLC